VRMCTCLCIVKAIGSDLSMGCQGQLHTVTSQNVAQSGSGAFLGSCAM
jgi:hypothetical protein